VVVASAGLLAVAFVRLRGGRRGRVAELGDCEESTSNRGRGERRDRKTNAEKLAGPPVGIISPINSRRSIPVAWRIVIAHSVTITNQSFR
jgi:hypothetical protein